jgi:hypothetical protein
MSSYSASFVDYQKRIIKVDWSEKVWLDHLKKHQLIDPQYCSNMIDSTVKNPHIVLEGSRPGDKEATAIYYREEREYQNFITYTKVVCGIVRNKLYVKTVYIETAPADLVIQEKKYPNNFKETWRTKTHIL